jgi:hypothetical protein
MDKEKRLDEFNKFLTSHSPQEINKSDIDVYMSLVRDLVKERMQDIVDCSDSRKRQNLLRGIFPMQYHLMKVRMMTEHTIPDDVWEVAKDFDNDDPLSYDYLINKILKGEYLLQGK